MSKVIAEKDNAINSISKKVNNLMETLKEKETLIAKWKEERDSLSFLIRRSFKVLKSRLSMKKKRGAENQKALDSGNNNEQRETQQVPALEVVWVHKNTPKEWIL